MRNEGTRGRIQGAKKDNSPSTKASHPLTFIPLLFTLIRVLSMNLATIDIGTNAVLLLLMNGEGSLQEILDSSTITRLGQGLLQSGHLSSDAMERTTSVLEHYRAVVDRNNGRIVRCFGTSALREAKNRQEFIELARSRTGIDVEVFSEYEEAYYTYLSVRDDEAIAGENLVIVDIGGGSTEITKGNREEFRGFVSYPIGTIKLTERFIRHNPPTAKELDELASFIRKELQQERPVDQATIVGMAGTMTTLAAMVQGLNQFDRKRIHAFPISALVLNAWIEKLAGMTTEERKSLPGMEPGREDLLLQGMILMREILDALGVGSFLVSTYGARYGVIFEALQENSL
jgi:exopolyphosphatase / guanosine-5'-triphosphate,3'-diphosphate pyrophosphatase